RCPACPSARADCPCRAATSRVRARRPPAVPFQAGAPACARRAPQMAPGAGRRPRDGRPACCGCFAFGRRAAAEERRGLSAKDAAETAQDDGGAAALGSASQADQKVHNLMQRFPDVSQDRIRRALELHEGHAGAASQHLRSLQRQGGSPQRHADAGRGGGCGAPAGGRRTSTADEK
ncbi:unnamed protein product, partial [Prorocentrum cordatum]